MRPVQPGEIPTESGFYAEPTPEVPRTFMQRAMGTALAVPDVALTVADAAIKGLIAPAAGLPALVTGRGEEGAKKVLSTIRQPQTPEGQAILQSVAPVMEAFPAVIGTGQPALGTAGAASRQAGRAVGQEAQMVRGAIEAPLAARREAQALKASAADYQRAPQIDAAQKAVEYGIALNPAESNPNLSNRARSMLVGNRDVNAQLSAQNAPKWTELAKRDMGVPQQTQLNAEGFAQARKQFEGPYEQIRRMGTMTASPDVRSTLEGLYVTEPTVGGEVAARRVNKLVTDAVKKTSEGIDGSRTLDSIRQLRRDAQAIRNAQKLGQAPSPEKLAEADVKLQIANTLETMVEESIFDPRFLGEFRDARRGLAKTFAYEEATDFNTGRVDPMAIARRTQQDSNLTGIIADIGAIAGNYPDIAAASVPASFAQRRMTRSGIAGTLGAGIGTVTPIGPIAGGVLGAGIGEMYTGLRARKIGTPEYQQRFAAPVDRRIRPPQVNELAPPTPGTPALYNWENALLRESEMPYRPDFTFVPTPPETQFVGPAPGPAQLPAPSAEATMANVQRMRAGQYQSDMLRAQAAEQAAISPYGQMVNQLSAGQVPLTPRTAQPTQFQRVQVGVDAQGAPIFEVRQMPVTRFEPGEAQFGRRGTPQAQAMDFDPTTGRFYPAKPTPSEAVAGAPTSLQTAVEKLSGQMVAEKIKGVPQPATRQPQAFALTAEERIAWNKAKADLAEVAPGMKSLSDKAIAEKMMDRQWVADAVRTAREKAAAFEQIAARAKDAQARQKALADQERMLDLLQTLEEKFRVGRPQPSGGQGPKTREFQRNQLLQRQEQNRNKLIEL
jgi:hypothetical protein